MMRLGVATGQNTTGERLIFRTTKIMPNTSVRNHIVVIGNFKGLFRARQSIRQGKLNFYLKIIWLRGGVPVRGFLPQLTLRYTTVICC